MTQRHSVRFFLRDRTATCHERVDFAFARFDLSDAGSYAAFLTAHARVVPPVEAMLDGAALWPEWRARGGLLQADLAGMGIMVPSPAAIGIAAPSDAARWGLLYVLEGSRLGGAMLAKRVPAGLPVAYLGAAHRDGSWGRFGDAIEAAGAAGGAEWREDALTGAIQGFALFERAAAAE